MARGQLMKHKLNAGFTLIELLVVSSILVMLLLTASAMFMTFLIGNAKTSIRQQLKAEGQQVINKIEFELRNARDITSTCPTSDAPSITYTDLSNVSHVIGTASNQIVIDAIPLTTNFSVANPVSFNCSQDATQGNRFIRFSFTLANKDVGEVNTAAQGISEVFSGQVAVRNY